MNPVHSSHVNEDIRRQQDPAKLKDWIDGDHKFDVTESSRTVFLNQPDFSEEDLKHGLIYARDRIIGVAQDLLEIAGFAREHHRYSINVDYLMLKWKDYDDHFPGKTLGRRSVARFQGCEDHLEDGLAGAVKTGMVCRRSLRSFKKTLAAFCREKDDQYLRNAVNAEQEGDGVQN